MILALLTIFILLSFVLKAVFDKVVEVILNRMDVALL